MALPQAIQQWVKDFQEDEGALDSFQPQHPNDLIGVEIVYEHPQSFELCFGEVIDWQVHPKRGLYLLVDQAGRNIPKWVNEVSFVCYGWEYLETTAYAIAS